LLAVVALLGDRQVLDPGQGRPPPLGLTRRRGLGRRPLGVAHAASMTTAPKELFVADERQTGCDQPAPTALVDDVHAVVLPVRPGDPEDDAQPAPEPEPPFP